MDDNFVSMFFLILALSQSRVSEFPHQNFISCGINQADSGKLEGDSDCSSVLRVADAELEADDDCLGQVPDSSWAVPQMPSPPTASGLHWPRSLQNHSYSAAFVPDISSSPVLSLHCHHLNDCNSKWRRHS